MSDERLMTDTSRWQAVVQRDARADGQLYFGVRTTGVFCRPSCPARRPRRENVIFYDTLEAAQRSGLRACKRCSPDGVGAAERRAALVTELCRLIDASDAMPDLAALARTCGLSRFHLQRLFKRELGLSPLGYARAQRARRVRAALSAASSVTGALYEAGFNSSSRFYAASHATLGMAPRAYRRGGAGETIRFALGQCSLGALLVAATEHGVCAILLGDEPEPLLRDLQLRFQSAELIGGDVSFEQLMARVTALVDAPARGLDLPLDVRGTVFQQRVWQALSAIPAGRTVSYAEIAQQLGRPSAVRAVGQAVAANPLAIAIPCHRVVRSDGALSGYRWGVERKRALLDRESAAHTS